MEIIFLNLPRGVAHCSLVDAEDDDVDADGIKYNY